MVIEEEEHIKGLLCAGEREVSVKDAENNSDPGHQVLPKEEIAESVLVGDQPGESSSSDSEDEVVVRPKMSQVPDCIVFMCSLKYIQKQKNSITMKKMSLFHGHKPGRLNNNSKHSS